VPHLADLHAGRRGGPRGSEVRNLEQPRLAST
jgi:hypothetical protein